MVYVLLRSKKTYNNTKNYLENYLLKINKKTIYKNIKCTYSLQIIKEIRDRCLFFGINLFFKTFRLQYADHSLLRSLIILIFFIFHKLALIFNILFIFCIRSDFSSVRNASSSYSPCKYSYISWSEIVLRIFLDFSQLVSLNFIRWKECT